MRFSSKENDEVTITEPKIHASVFERIMYGANDAVIGLPDIADYFYVGRWKAGRNVGTAKIKIETVTSIANQ